MNILSARLIPVLLLPGLIFAQPSPNGPFVHVESYESITALGPTLQEELEYQNWERLGGIDVSNDRAQLFECVVETEETFLLFPEEELLLEHLLDEVELEAEYLALISEYRLVAAYGLLSEEVKDPEWEGAEHILGRESTLQQIELGLLAKHLSHLQAELAGLGQEIPDWNASQAHATLATETEAAKWMLQVEPNSSR